MESIKIEIDANEFIEGDLSISSYADKVIVFAHGSGSSRFSVRNRFVADILQRAGLSTLLLDLLTKREESIDNITAAYRFNIELLSERLIRAIRWLEESRGEISIGYFGASTGAAAALIASAKYPNNIKAIVSRGGRPDLAMHYLSNVRAPTLLIVGSKDHLVLELNREVIDHFKNTIVKLVIIPNATHLFEEPNALEQVAENAKEWFIRYL